MPVTMIVSEDAGETWTNKEVLDHPGVRRSYAGMSGDGSFIYALMCVDKTMGSEATVLCQHGHGKHMDSQKADR